MFIPNKESRMTVGTKVKLRRDVKTCAGTFTRGHRFTVYAVGDRGPDLVDEDGLKLDEMILSLDALEIVGHGDVPPPNLPLTDKNLEQLAASIWATVGGDNPLWENNEKASQWLRSVCSALAYYNRGRNHDDIPFHAT